MKKLLFAFSIVVFLFLAVKIVSAGKPTDSLSILVYELQAKVEQLAARVTLLEQKYSNLNKYYTKDFGPFNADAGIAVTVTYGCEDGDIAISGGMFNYQGRISNWRTVRSYPGDSQYNNHIWETTIINEVENGSFNLRVKCLDLN